MTGSVFQRQHSSIPTCSHANQVLRPALRRCSSAEDCNTMNTVSKKEENQKKQLLSRDHTNSDDDSGIEDPDQQIAKSIQPAPDSVNQKDSSLEFGPCEKNNQNASGSAEIVPEQSIFGAQYITIDDLTRASRIPDDVKKDFCPSTTEIFHAEFALRILFPMYSMNNNFDYRLYADEWGINSDPQTWPGFYCIKLDNAKAQFKCPNPSCQRSWTSMRARISFAISWPSPNGFVVLKIFGQTCQQCEAFADALWYPEEVCRVVKNLSESMYAWFFGIVPNYSNLQCIESVQRVNATSRRSKHDSSQRQGKMHAPHDSYHCEACIFGYCFS